MPLMLRSLHFLLEHQKRQNPEATKRRLVKNDQRRVQFGSILVVKVAQSFDTTGVCIGPDSQIVPLAVNFENALVFFGSTADGFLLQPTRTICC